MGQRKESIQAVVGNMGLGLGLDWDQSIGCSVGYGTGPAV